MTCLPRKTVSVEQSFPSPVTFIIYQSVCSFLVNLSVVLPVVEAIIFRASY